MKSSTRRMATMLLAGLMLMGYATGGISTAQPPLPNPVLIFMGREPFEANGKQWSRYRYLVTNSTDYPNDMFASAPDLPPCGSNTKSSRTWVDIFEQNGKRLYGFCALKDRDGLTQLWFALESDVIPPSWIYVELNDRKTNTKYKSNLTETTE